MRKAEVSGLPVHVYLPFIEGAQDEKQFWVMWDRERWFNVAMGERLEQELSCMTPRGPIRGASAGVTPPAMRVPTASGMSAAPCPASLGAAPGVARRRGRRPRR